MEHNNKNTFRLSDESINSYGLIVKTDGINLERFIKNPVMLYSHSTEGGKYRALGKHTDGKKRTICGRCFL